MNEFLIVIKDMPSGLKGCVNMNIDGSYTIFINARLNFEQQQEIYLHEVKHILSNDFCEYNADEIEYKNMGRNS